MKITYFLFLVLVFVSCAEDSTNSKTTSTEVIRPKKVNIELFAEQFKWTVRYSGEDNTLGKFDYKLINEFNPLGLMTIETIESSLVQMVNDETTINKGRRDKLVRLVKQMKDKHDLRIDASAKDDIILSDTLVLCQNQEYEFHFRSKDVIHSAYFPDFRAQMNTVPGMTTRFKYTPTVTTNQMRIDQNASDFEFKLMCNKICGSGHYSMKMVVRVIEEKEYDAWMKKKSAHSFQEAIQKLK